MEKAKSRTFHEVSRIRYINNNSGKADVKTDVICGTILVLLELSLAIRMQHQDLG